MSIRKKNIPLDQNGMSAELELNETNVTIRDDAIVIASPKVEIS